MLRRHHQGDPPDTEPDGNDTTSDTAEDAPPPKAAGRSRSRKTSKEG